MICYDFIILNVGSFLTTCEILNWIYTSKKHLHVAKEQRWKFTKKIKSYFLTKKKRCKKIKDFIKYDLLHFNHYKSLELPTSFVVQGLFKSRIKELKGIFCFNDNEHDNDNRLKEKNYELIALFHGFNHDYIPLEIVMEDEKNPYDTGTKKNRMYTISFLYDSEDQEKREVLQKVNIFEAAVDIFYFQEYLLFEIEYDHYDSSDKKIKTTNFQHEKHKIWYNHDPSVKRFEITFVNRIPQGNFKAWHTNNRVYKEGIYTDGKKIGEWKEWSANGQLRLQATYNEDEKREGEWKISLSSRFNVFQAMYNNNGEINDEWKKIGWR